MMRKSIVDEIGYYYEKKVFICEDYEYWLRAVLKNKKIYYIPEALIKYRYNPRGYTHSISLSKGRQKQINTLEVLKKTIPLNKKDLDKVNKKIISFKKLKQESKKEEWINKQLKVKNFIKKIYK